MPLTREPAAGTIADRVGFCLPVCRLSQPVRGLA